MGAGVGSGQCRTQTRGPGTNDEYIAEVVAFRGSDMRRAQIQATETSYVTEHALPQREPALVVKRFVIKAHW